MITVSGNLNPTNPITLLTLLTLLLRWYKNLGPPFTGLPLSLTLILNLTLILTLTVTLTVDVEAFMTCGAKTQESRHYLGHSG